jgi:hypothetical protein
MAHSDIFPSKYGNLGNFPLKKQRKKKEKKKNPLYENELFGDFVFKNQNPRLSHLFFLLSVIDLTVQILISNSSKIISQLQPGVSFTGEVNFRQILT